MKILLPDNAFGYILMIALVLAIIFVPLVVVGWLVSLVAPWWVAVPCALSSSLAVFLVTVKFK
jgi:hypothetical protein